MRFPSSRSIDAIIDDRVYIGNILAATTLHEHPELAITHVLSVCKESVAGFSPEEAPCHLTIGVHDTEYDDLLIHLSKACRFIQAALDEGGKVLVHCVMGVSRSATVLCAYLMQTRGLSLSEALSTIKQRRPRVQPNYGFMRQLHAFAACSYAPAPTNPAYRTWKRRQRQDVTAFFNSVSDTVPIFADRLYLSSEFPEDPDKASCLLAYLGLTHFITLGSTQQIPSSLSLNVKHQHFEIPKCGPEGLLLSLPETCRKVQEAIDCDGRVVVYCLTESNAAIVVCAYLMWSRKIPYDQAFKIIHAALPLFNCTEKFARCMQIFDACHYTPQLDSPLVQSWFTELGGPYAALSSVVASVGNSSNTHSSPITATNSSPVTGKLPVSQKVVAGLAGPEAEDLLLVSKTNVERAPIGGVGLVVGQS